MTLSRMQDPILGITENFLADTNDIKMNLGVVCSRAPECAGVHIRKRERAAEEPVPRCLSQRLPTLYPFVLEHQYSRDQFFVGIWTHSSRMTLSGL